MSRSSPLTLVACAGAIAFQTGCVSPGTPDTIGLSRPGTMTTVRSTDVVGHEELSTIRANTAYDVVVQLRPEFLHRRGASGPEQRESAEPIVYLDGVRQGSLESLHTIPAQLVKEVRFLSPSQAIGLFGPGNYGRGAIAILSR